jgi:uncharacterized protein
MLFSRFNMFNKPDVIFTKKQLPFLVLAFAPIFLYGVDFKGLFTVTSTTPKTLFITGQALVGDKAIKLEVSKTAITHQSGLTYRPDIPQDRGMLYLTTASNPLSFNGKGMMFATDLIFLNNGKVVGFYANIAPCKDTCTDYTIKEAFDSALEVKAGTIERLGITNGTKIPVAYEGKVKR